MDVNKVRALMEEALEVNKELFLISFSVSNGSDIEVIVDGDKGVSLEECIRISRHIEHNLDRETEDFGLSVKSPDIMKPLIHPRQYIKNIGRKLVVSTNGEKIEGTLLSIEDEKIFLEWKAREPKPIGKGKHTVTKQARIAIEDIEQATVKIVFN